MPTRRRVVRAMAQLETRRGAESTERCGLTIISASQTTSSPHASAASTIWASSWKAPSWVTPPRICSAKTPKSMARARDGQDIESAAREMRRPLSAPRCIQSASWKAWLMRSSG